MRYTDPLPVLLLESRPLDSGVPAWTGMSTTDIDVISADTDTVGVGRVLSVMPGALER